MNPKLTKTQSKTLETIVRLRDRRGITPTQAELAKSLRLSKSGVRVRLNMLERLGYIRLVPRIARGIVVNS